MTDPSPRPSVPEQAAAADLEQNSHEVVVADEGSFTIARCSCGWYSPARRSRPLARTEAADHLRLHGLLS